MAFVRSSKYRHIFGTALKRDKCYDGIRITKSPYESNMCAVNAKFLAVVLEAQGGGAFLVAPLTAVGRFDINYPKVCGHKSLVMDVQWNPFNDNEIASSSEDCLIMIWNIPDGGLKDNVTDPQRTLTGHNRKVGHIAWHPSASDILASVGFDPSVIIWNTATGEKLYTLEGHTDIIYSISWSYDGSFLATTCKDKKIRVFDPRKEEIVSEGAGHGGTKPSRVVFCGTLNKLLSTGFSRQSDRQYALWNPSDLSKPMVMENIDTGSGVLFPFYDEGTKVVYIAGKGDGSIKYFEITPDKSPYIHFLSMYQSSLPQRGMGCMPKRELDYMKCEVMRFYRLLNKGIVEPVMMTVPRKSEMFQEDIFQPTFSGKPAMSADDWISGMNKDPLLVEFSADGLSDLSASKSQVSKTLTFGGKKEAAKKEKKEPKVLRRLHSKSPEADHPSYGEPTTLEEYRSAYQDLLEENKKLKARIAELEK